MNWHFPTFLLLHPILHLPPLIGLLKRWCTIIFNTLRHAWYLPAKELKVQLQRIQIARSHSLSDCARLNLRKRGYATIPPEWWGPFEFQLDVFTNGRFTAQANVWLSIEPSTFPEQEGLRLQVIKYAMPSQIKISRLTCTVCTIVLNNMHEYGS